MFRRSTLDLPFRDSLQGIDDVLALQVAQFAITNLVRQSIEAMAHRRTALLSRKMLGGEVLHHFAYRRLCRFSGRCIALRFLCDTQGRKARLAFCHEISASMTIGFPRPLSSPLDILSPAAPCLSSMPIVKRRLVPSNRYSITQVRVPLPRMRSDNPSPSPRKTSRSLRSGLALKQVAAD
jgi:hypothetical protein